MTAARTPVKIDFSELTDNNRAQQPRIDSITARAAIEDAKAAGFTTRAPQTHVDGRTLRKTGRSAQLNIKVRPETKLAFFEAAAEFPSTQDFLVHLLTLARRP